MKSLFIPARPVVLALLAALIATATLSLGLGGGFILDDGPTITENLLVQIESVDRESLLTAASSFFAGGGSRPLPMLSFALDYWRAGGLDAAAFKTTNLLIHGLSVFVLFFLLDRLFRVAGWPKGRAIAFALVISLLWAIHPLQVSSVLYVVQRMQTMATLFVLTALWSYLLLRDAQIQGRAGWGWGIAAGLSGGLALLCKEDAILLIVFALAFELTVLGFRAASAQRSFELRRAWFGVVLVGLLGFVFWFIPHYWSTAPYDGREFNSTERLLTQGRVLTMYLGQILFPAPALMPFNYDQLEVSRGLLVPVTTVLSWLLLMALAGWAWIWRLNRPVFSLGIFLFFAGHLLTSNVIPLELAFEHRNQIPLLGILLAAVDMVRVAEEKFRLGSRPVVFCVSVVVVLVTFAGAMRAYHWGDPVRLAAHNVEINPQSPRAWLALGGVYFDLAGRRLGGDSPLMDLAIAAAAEGAERTGSPIAYSNVVIYRTIQGTVTEEDWAKLLRRVDELPVNRAVNSIVWTSVANVRAKIGLDIDRVVQLLDSITTRGVFSSHELLRIGVAIYLNAPDPEPALGYFVQAARAASPDDRSLGRLQRDLIEQGRSDWARQINDAMSDARM
jgi:hypothetical protein